MSTLTSPNKAFILLMVSLLTLKTFCMDIQPILEIDLALIFEIIRFANSEWYHEVKRKFGQEITSGKISVNYPPFSVCSLI